MMNSEPGGVPPPETTSSWLSELVSSPLNLALLALCGYLLYKIVASRRGAETPRPPPEPALPKLKRRDWTLGELKQYDGRVDTEGRILVAVNGKVFDMTRGKRFYGPGGPYSVFAGRDATRALATFSLTDEISDEYDDVSDLTPSQLESVREWEEQFKEKYDYIGKLLKPGEDATEYSESEDEGGISFGGGSAKGQEDKSKHD